MGTDHTVKDQKYKYNTLGALQVNCYVPLGESEQPCLTTELRKWYSSRSFVKAVGGLKKKKEREREIKPFESSNLPLVRQ